MRIRKAFGKLFSVLMICLLVAGSVAFPSAAKAEDKTGSIAFEFGEPMGGVEFSIYHVATPDGHDGFDPTADFAGYAVDLWGSTAAETLQSYVRRDGIKPLKTEVTDPDGNILFDELTIGAYLILGEDFETEDLAYTIQPVMVCIPTRNEITQELDWDLTVGAKYDVHTVSHDVNRKVTAQKVWSGDSEKNRPKSVTVQLLADGEVADEVELSAENNWSYEWPKLDAARTWTVVEKEVPKNYKVSITRKDTDSVFVIKNTYDTPSTTPENPSKEHKLPKTGQLWWPVSILLCAGMLCVTIGLLIRKRD